MKKCFVIFMAAVVVLSGAFCGFAAEKKYNISVILKTTASEYWGYVVAGTQAYGKDHPNVHVQVKGATSETAYDEQQNMIEESVKFSVYRHNFF